MYVDAIERNDMVMCWYRDENNDLLFLEEPAPYYCYRRNETNSTHKSLFGDNLSKQEFESRNAYSNYVNKRKNLFESDISPVYKFLSDTFYETEDTALNIAFFDIEVDYDLADGNGYPRPETHSVRSIRSHCIMRRRMNII